MTHSFTGTYACNGFKIRSGDIWYTHHRMRYIKAVCILCLPQDTRLELWPLQPLLKLSLFQLFSLLLRYQSPRPSDVIEHWDLLIYDVTDHWEVDRVGFERGRLVVLGCWESPEVDESEVGVDLFGAGRSGEQADNPTLNRYYLLYVVGFISWLILVTYCTGRYALMYILT